MPNTTIPDLPTVAPEGADLLIVEDVSGAATGKITVTAFLSLLGGGFLQADGSVAAAADIDFGDPGLLNVQQINGRDVVADGAKLDAVEAGAQLTNTTRVAAAGALMTTGGTMTGSILMSPGDQVDGRDVSADGAKLDGVEEGARATLPVVAVSGTTLTLDFALHNNAILNCTNVSGCVITANTGLAGLNCVILRNTAGVVEVVDGTATGIVSTAAAGTGPVNQGEACTFIALATASYTLQGNI